MVNVISTQPHKSVVKEVICGNCGSQLEYVPRDIKEHVHTDYTGGTDKSYFIECPNCSNKVHVKRV